MLFKSERLNQIARTMNGKIDPVDLAKNEK